MTQKLQIAYQGNKFDIEWYFDNRGSSQALDYYEALSQKEKLRVLYLFKRMGDGGHIYDVTKFNYECDQIYAFKPQPNRFLCFFYDGKKVIVTNAFEKKKTKLPKEQKERALKNKRDYERRVKEDSYYD